MIRTCVFATCLPAFLGMPTLARAAVRYELIPIAETLGTGVSVVGTDLNNGGMVSGIATSSFIDDLAFRPWIADVHTGKGIELAPAAGSNQYLYAGPISERGHVAGHFIAPQSGDGGPLNPFPTQAGLPVPFGTTSYALFWHTDGSGTFTPIPGLGSILRLREFGNIVTDMNASGACVGISRDGSNDPFTSERAFLLDENGVLHDLSGIGGPGTRTFSLSGISNNGRICGVMRHTDGSEHGFVRDALGNLTFLPSVFNSREGVETVYPYKINSAGQVIGVAVLLVPHPTLPFPEAFQRAFLWNPVAGMTDLGNYFPSALNEAGELTAQLPLMTPLGPQIHAFVRYTDGTWVDLNDVMTLPDCDGGNWIARAPAINDAGAILVVEQYCPQSVFIEHRTHVLVPQPARAADISGDGSVNVDDLLAVITSWGACPVPPTTCPADIAPSGGDGQVSVDDLLLVVTQWGACP